MLSQYVLWPSSNIHIVSSRLSLPAPLNWYEDYLTEYLVVSRKTISTNYNLYFSQIFLILKSCSRLFMVETKLTKFNRNCIKDYMYIARVTSE